MSVDIHLACACICVYVHADLRYALTFLLGMSGRRHLRRPLCLCAWTQQGVSFHPLWSLCLMFLLRACVPQVYIPLTLVCTTRIFATLVGTPRAACEFKKSLLFYGHDTPVARACLRYAKLIVFIFSGMVWKRTSLTNSASMTPRAECEFKIKNFLRLILYISAIRKRQTACVLC